VNKTIVFLLCFSWLFTCLIGCGSNGDDQDGKTTVVFWHSFVSSTIPALNELLAKFEEEHPHIRVKAQYIPTGDALLQKLVTSIQSGNAPDVSWVHAQYFGSLAGADAIYPMDEFINGPNGFTEEELNDFYPALLKLSSWKGTLYSLPMEGTNLGLLYNKGLFRKAGLDPNKPPETWDELYEYAKKLTIDENRDGKFEQVGFLVPVFPASGPLGSWTVWQWIPFLWQAGGYVINEEQTRVLYNSEAGVAALSYWKKMYDEFKLNDFTNEFDYAFISEQLVMTPDGPWNLPRYKDILKNLDWGIAPLPKGPVKHATIVGGEYLTIFKQSEHPEAAWEFVKWIVKPETQAFWSMKSMYLPVRRSVLEIQEYRDFLEEHPNLKAYVEQMQYAQRQRDIDYYNVEINRHMAEAIEQATVGKRDPAAALNEAAAKSNKLLDSVKRD